jgi:hypothetical protein
MLAHAPLLSMSGYTLRGKSAIEALSIELSLVYSADQHRWVTGYSVYLDVSDVPSLLGTFPDSANDQPNVRLDS